MLEFLKHILEQIYNVRGLIEWGGTLMVCVIIFIETGMFAGFFLPGDSLLVTAGVFAGAGQLKLAWLLSLATLCAIAGDQLGYLIGWKAGASLYSRPDSRFFKKKHLEQAHEFYEHFGGKTVIMARFVPIIRTFCPPVAGAAQMPYGRYFAYDVVGGVLWGGGMVLGGFLLGRQIPNISDNIHYVTAVVIFLSLLPPIIGFLRSRSSGSAKPSSLPQPAPPERD